MAVLLSYLIAMSLFIIANLLSPRPSNTRRVVARQIVRIVDLGWIFSFHFLTFTVALAIACSTSGEVFAVDIDEPLRPSDKFSSLAVC